MYAALFEMDSWMGNRQYIFEGESASELLAEFERVQDLACLVRMGRGEEDSEGQKALDKLERLLDKYYDGTLTIDGLLGLDVEISVGSIKCICIKEGENAVEKLKELYPGAK